MKLNTWKNLIIFIVTFLFAITNVQAGEKEYFKNWPHHHKCKKDRAAILELYAVTDAAFASGDLETWAEFYTDDVVAFYPGIPLITGIEAVKESVGALFGDPNVSITVTPDVIEIAKACDQAMTYGKGVTRILDPASGQFLVEYTKFMTLLKKQRDGSWKATADIFNSDGPIAPEE